MYNININFFTQALNEVNCTEQALCKIYFLETIWILKFLLNHNLGDRFLKIGLNNT
jgi:hypothetical protein